MQHTIQPRPGPREAQLLRSPCAFSTRRVPASAMRHLCSQQREPRPGDLVLVRIEELGHHTRLHLPNGRRRQLFAGDRAIVTFANRYASRQFEAVVPADLAPCHLVAAGGVVSRVIARHDRTRPPTRVCPLGLLSSAPGGPPINLSDWGLPVPAPPEPRRTPTIAVAGTAMSSGKSMAAAHLVRGLTRTGKRVGFAKLTGTSAAGDPWLLADAGADPVLDFSDVGFASTYLLDDAALERILLSLLGHLQAAGVDVAVLEIADGLLQEETAALVALPAFGELVDALLLAGRDSMGAVCGVRHLEALGRRVLAVTGLLTTSPLQLREARQALRLPVLGRAELSDPTLASKLLSAALS